MKQLKSWFFSTVRGLNSRGKFINLADFGEPDQITFTDFLDTTLTKKIDAFNFQDQADFNNINARLDGDKFVNPSGLPDLIILPGVPLTVTTVPATSLTPRHIYNIDVVYPNNADIIARVTDKLVNPNNLPVVEADPAPGNTITVSTATLGGFTTYKVFSTGGAGDFVLKTGDTMTGALVVDGDVIISIDNSSSTNTSIFGAAIVAQNPGAYEFAYDGSGILTLSTTGVSIRLDVTAVDPNNHFIEAPSLIGRYLRLDTTAALLADISGSHSRLYATAGVLRYRKVGQNFDTDLVFNSTVNRTFNFPDASGTIALTSSLRISALVSANTGNTIDNGNFNQVWRWQLTSGSSIGLNITETAASTGGAGFQQLVKIATVFPSTADPLLVQAVGVDALKIFASGQINMGIAGSPVGLYGKVISQHDFGYFSSIDSISAGGLNNYAVDNKTHIIFTAGVLNITGFTAPSPAFGKTLIITNGSGAPFNIMELNGASALANQIVTNSSVTDISLLVGGSITLIYDTGISKWRVISN